jgi:hypothetical protein
MRNLTDASVGGKRSGLIGETYWNNLTHISYCSTGNQVPHKWFIPTAPLGFGFYVVFSGLSIVKQPEFSVKIDTAALNSLPMSHQNDNAITGITYFACEPSASTGGASSGSAGGLAGVAGLPAPYDG